MASPPRRHARRLDANAVVAHNLRAIRERTGWTQRRVAEELSRLTGRAVTEADIAARELVASGRRRHRFDAHELYLLAVVFDVPIVYFFLPPPGSELDPFADTDRPAASLYAYCLGRAEQLFPVDERLREVRIGDPADTAAALRSIFRLYGGGPKGWREQYYSWRADRLYQMGEAYGRQLADMGGFLVELGRSIREAAPEAFLADGVAPTEQRSG